MRNILGWALIAIVAILGCAVSPADAAKKKTAAKRTASKKSGASSKQPAKSSRKSSKRSRPVARTTWRNRQLSPAPERYKEIQDALAAKGYLDPAEANGSWGANSVTALKRFQADQRIDGNGKINSLSLIALGLGTKSAPAAGQSAAPAAPESEPTPPEAK